MGAEGRAKIGLTDGMVGISVGIEDVNDILADLEQALGGRSKLNCGTGGRRGLRLFSHT